MSAPRSRRGVLVVLTALVAVTCVGLGFWQLARLEDRRALNTRITDRASAPPVTIERATVASVAYRRAIAEGTYDAADEVLLYGRSLDGQPGHHVVTPLVLANGDTLLVVRGWVPFTNRSAPVPDATPPSGEVRVRGVLVPDEGDGSAAPDASGVIGTLDVAGIGTTLPSDLFPLPLQLTEQSPPQPGDLPVPVPLPERSEGPHRSYAIQWFAFAAVAVAGAAILARRGAPAARHAPTADP